MGRQFRLYLLLTPFAFLIPSVSASTRLTQKNDAQMPTVPFVGCPADGMSGPVSAPSDDPHKLPIPFDAAQRLALYSDANGFSVIAPRGWHCYEVYGSDGAFLIVSPYPVSEDTILSARRPKGFVHPVVVFSAIDGFTSGRDEVSPIINRVFPKHRAFVINAAKEMDQPVPRKQAPFRSDKLHYLSKDAVEYKTPANREGLGTASFLRPSVLAITGVEILVKDRGDCCDLTSLAVRLAPSDEALAPVINRYIEHEAAKR
jgi:hypothetical protein